MNEKQKEIVRKMIYAVETGGQVYGKARYDCYVGKNTNSTKETACTIGAAGNHAGNAKKLLQMILASFPGTFRKYDTADIEEDLKLNWTTYDPGVGSKKARCIQRIISTDAGIKCQDALLDQQMESRVEKAADMGVSNLDAQIMCANVIHLGGEKALRRILAKCKEPYTLNNIFAALKTDQLDGSSANQVGDKKYWSRHEKIYGWIKEKITNREENKVNEKAYKQAKTVVDFVKSRYRKNQYTQSSLRYKVEEGWSDCSSLVRAAFLKIGINIGDWTGAQVKKGRKIEITTTDTNRDTTNLQMGDLVFFKNPNHVEMYVGGDQLLGHGSGIGPDYHNVNTYRQGDFWQVRRYIDDIGAVTEEPDLPAEPEDKPNTWKATGTATCKGDSVNVRSTPKKGDNIIGQLGKGNRLEIDGKKSGEWVHIRVMLNGENVVCWIHRDYVDYDQEESDVILTATTDLNVRVYAGVEYKKLKSYPVIKKGKKVVKLGEVKATDGDIWYKIRISGKQGDKVGFASGKHLK